MDGRRIPPGPPRPATPNVGLPRDPEPVEACVSVFLSSLATPEWYIITATRATFEPHLEEGTDIPDWLPRIADRISHMVLTFVENVHIVGTPMPVRYVLDPMPYYSLRGWFEADGRKALIECDKVEFDAKAEPDNVLLPVEQLLFTVTTRDTFMMRFDVGELKVNET